MVVPLRDSSTVRALALDGERTVGESGAYRGDGVKQMEVEPGGRKNCCSVRVEAKG